MARLTKRFVDGLEPGVRDYFAWDDRLPGFGVRVMPSGAKTYQLQYRKGGRTRRMALGRHGKITVDQARSAARAALGQIASGANPAEEVRQERRAPTIGALCDRFLADHVASHCKASSAAEYRRVVERFIRPAFGSFRIGDLSRSDVAEYHLRHRHIPYQANRTLGVLSKMLNLAEAWGLRPDGSNPCRHIAKYREDRRERFLSDEELQRLGQVLSQSLAFGTESPFVVAAFRLLILTGCRLSEIQKLRWDYLDGNHMVLPDTKTGARRIPLPRAAREVLDALPRLDGNPFVIAGDKPGQHVTDLQKPWRRIRARAGLADVRIHDLRHTYASNAVSNGMPIQMVGKLLGHTQLQTTMRYAHLADDPVSRAAEENAARLEAAIADRERVRLVAI